MREELLDGVAAVDGGAIPNDHHTTGHLALQVLEKRDDIVRNDGAVLAMEVQLALRREGSDGREAVARPPLS
jgi:hypothetical protein